MLSVTRRAAAPGSTSERQRRSPELEHSALHHRIERGEDHLVGQIAGHAEDHQRVGWEEPSGASFLAGGLFLVAAELKAQRGQQLVGEVILRRAN
jgi:hypothetical protein